MPIASDSERDRAGGGRPGRPWLLVAGDFTPLGGMDCANYALARHLAAGAGREVHLVTHRAWDDLAGRPGVRVHRVARPRGSHLLGMPLLARAGRRWARRLAAGGARVVVNGGNCAWGDVNWVHYVHAAWDPVADGPPARRAKAAVAHRYFRATERARVRRAWWVVANSERTRAALIERLGLPAGRVHTVYYGIDPDRFGPPTAAGRAEARARLGWAGDGRPAVAFVGALGDRRKGFDTLFGAWRALAGRPSWDARLVVVGAGAALASWRARAAAAGLGRSIQFLGFRADVPVVLAACDLLVSPARYEPYGLNVHEALCCGLPALVSASAGVAERYPPGLRGLLLPDPEDDAELARRLLAWRDDPAAAAAAVAPLGHALRARTWDHCAAEIVRIVDSD
jgi:glycosyltransferase involved in cell wall biosynthesis